MISKTSSVSYDETVERLRDGLEQRQQTLFAAFDHAAAAREAGLALEPELVLVFGNPRAGTQLMVDDPEVGIELPLKLLVYERGGVVTLAYHDPHELPGPDQILDAMAALLSALVDEAAAER